MSMRPIRTADCPHPLPVPPDLIRGPLRARVCRPNLLRGLHDRQETPDRRGQGRGGIVAQRPLKPLFE